MLSMKEAAARLGVSQKTLRRWADVGRVPVVRLPSGYRRFTVEMIEQVERQMGLDPERRATRPQAEQP